MKRSNWIRRPLALGAALLGVHVGAVSAQVVESAPVVELAQVVEVKVRQALRPLARVAPRPVRQEIVRIDERRPLRPDAAVSLEAVTHSFVVTAWERNEIQITGEYDSDVDEIEVGGDDAAFHFEVGPEGRTFFRGRNSSRGSSRLEVRLPAGVRLSIETVSGTVTLTSLRGSVTASSVSGQVDVTGNLTTADLSSVSGGVRYTGDASDVRMEAVSGSVDYRGRARSLRIESVSGSVSADGGWETVEAEAVSGSIRLSSDRPVRSIDADAVSGSIRFNGQLTRDARVNIESHSGMVEMVLPSSTDARFELSSFSGNVTSNLRAMRDEVRTRSRRGPPNESLAFTMGSGSANVTASSFSGSVRILELGQN